MKKTILYLILMVITATGFSQNVYVVTKTTDPNPFTYPYKFNDADCDPVMFGTLQWAINKSNDDNAESIIEFNIPGTGVQEILINSYLPQIKSNVTIDGTTQAGYTIENPVIKINGQFKVQFGFSIYGADVKISGLHIANFSNNAFLLFKSSNSEIIDNVITNIFGPGIGMQIIASNNVEIYGNNIEYNALNTSGKAKYGVYIDQSENCIIGSTDTGKANTIANCTKAGVAIASFSGNKISGNIIYNNSQAIVLAAGANGNIQPPVITSYTNGILSGTALSNSTVEVFGSTGPENANKYLGSVVVDENGEWNTEIYTNLEYFIAVQIDQNNNSSSVSIVFNNDLITTKLIDNDCNSQNVTFTQNLHSIELDNADYYLFTVTNENINLTKTIIKSINYFNLSELEVPLLFNSIYQVKVRCILGSDTTLYGPECNIKTENITMHDEFVYDRFGNKHEKNDIRKQVKANDIIINVGYFELTYRDVNDDNLLTQDVISCINQVFSDLSTLIIPNSCGGVAPVINILINAPTNLPQNVLGMASSFYDPFLQKCNAGPNLEVEGILESEVWRAINTGINDPNEFDGFIDLNLLNFNFNPNFNISTPSNEVDLYSVTIHELIHVLGFGSLFDNNGESIFIDNGQTYFSRYDLFLFNNVSNEYLIDLSAPYDIQIATSALLAMQQDCDEISFVGEMSTNEPISSYAFNGNMSHFGLACTPITDQPMMSPGINHGQDLRCPTNSVIKVLINLGYNISGVFGDGTCDFHQSDLLSGNIGTFGRIDGDLGFNSNCAFSYHVEICPPVFPIVDLSNILENDINASSIIGLEIVSGEGALNISTLSYSPSSPGLHALRYVPVDENGNLGNITCIYIETDFCCYEPEQCNLVCNPNMRGFDEFPSGMGSVPPSWNFSHGTSDWGENDVWAGALITPIPPPPSPGFVRMWCSSNTLPNGSGEGIMTELSSPIINGNTYSIYIDFAVMQEPFSSNPFINSFYVCIFDSEQIQNVPEPPNSHDVPVVDFNQSGIQIIAEFTDVSITGGWIYFEDEFIANGNYDMLWIFPHNPHQEEIIGGTVYVDEVGIIPISTPNSASNNGPYCPGQTIELLGLGDPNYTYTWYGPEDFVSSEQNPIIESPTINNFGTYYVTFTDTYGCVTTAQTTVTQATIDPPSPTNTGPYCVGEDIVLSVSNPNPDYEYFWDSEFWIYNSSDFNVEYYEAIRPNAQNNSCCNPDPFTWINFSGEYIVTARDENGCTASGSTYVVVAPDQSCLTAESNSPICAGDELSIFLHSEDNISNGFCDFANSEIIIQGPNGPVDFDLINHVIHIHDLESADAGTFTITINSPLNCSSKVLTTDVIIYPKPWVTLPSLPHLCMGQTIDITPVHSDNILQYTWNGPSYFSHDPVAHFTLPDATFGNHYLYITVTDINDCSATASTTLFIQPFDAFDAFITTNSPVCIGDPLQLIGNASINVQDLTYYWHGPNSFSLESDESNILQIANATTNNAGTYHLQITNSVGCVAFAEAVVDIIDCTPAFNLTCTAIPITCKSTYNGAVEIQISGGQAPYTAQVLRDNFSLATQILSEDGTHNISLEGIEPNTEALIIHITDYLNNTQEYTIFEGLTYAWDLVITNNNLHDINNYENMILAAGDNFENQNLDFYEDFTFTNCTIYTGVYSSFGAYFPGWDIDISKSVRFENTDILSGCPDRMWQGINVNGSVNSLQSENAHIEFENSSISDAIQAIQTYGGATASIRNSKFFNNVYDVYIDNAQYSDFEFYRNVFETNRRLKNQFQNPIAHVYMFKVRNVIFKGNTFRNTLAFDIPGYDTQNRGTGIYALKSTFTVTPVSNPYIIPMTPWATNSFEGLYYGINAKSESSYPPKVYRNTFTNNYRGVHLVAVTAPRLLFNNFTNTIDIPPVTTTIGIPVNEEPETNVSYAAYINSCTDFKVEENTVKGTQAGIYVYNTGDASGQQLYRNKFGDNPSSNAYNMYAGTLIVGKNSDYVMLDPYSTGLGGLEVRCNNYTSTNYAISVLNGNMRLNQGSNSTLTALLAGNQFHKVPLVNGMDYTVQIDAGFENLNHGTYNYWQHDDNPMHSIVNEYYRQLSSNASGVNPHTKLGVYYTAQSCPSNYQLPIVDDEFEDIMDDIAVIGASITATNELYDELVDRGDREYIKDIAEDLSPRNFQQYVPILSNDGYLSNEVFETILDNRKAQKPVIAAVLIANSPLPVEIMEQVESSTYLSNGHKKQVRNYQSGINARVLLEYNIADLEQEKAVKESHLINSAINNDSLPEVKDLIISYLDPQSSDYKKLIKIYSLNLSKQDYSASLANLGNIRQLASLPDNELISEELLKYCDIQEIFINTIQEDYSLFEYKDMLLDAALDGSALYSATAQVLYEIAADTTFAEYTPLPFAVIQPRKTEFVDPIDEEQFLPFINVYPNPTDAEINVEYDFAAIYTEGNDILLEKLGISRDEDCEKGELSLYTEDGKLLQQFRLNAVKDSFTITIKDFTPGNYLLVIKDCFGNSETVKITKYK